MRSFEIHRNLLLLMTIPSLLLDPNTTFQNHIWSLFSQLQYAPSFRYGEWYQHKHSFIHNIHVSTGKKISNNVMLYHRLP